MRATFSVLKRGAATCFYAITSAPGLTDNDRARLAERDGNEHVEPLSPYDEMMEQGGFVDVELLDVTAEYLETLNAWKREWEADATSIADVVGEEEFERRMRNRRLDISHVEAGLLQRLRVFGIKP